MLEKQNYLEDAGEKLDASENLDDKKIAEIGIQNDITKKQQIIKEKILDKGYNKNAFFEFCMKQNKVNGDDLSYWSFDELNAVITSFTNEEDEKIKQNQKLQNDLIRDKTMAESIQLNMEQIRKEKKDLVKPYIKEITCRKLEKSILNDKYVKTEVNNPKPIEEGFFSSGYILYDVCTEIKSDINSKEFIGQYVVNRRYNDFLALRQILCKTFPRNFIPPLPGKKIGGRRFEIDFIEKRMHFLNQFIKNLLKIETLRASEAVVAFLTINERMQFDSKIKELSTYQPSNYVEEMRTLDGKIAISIDDQMNEKYFVNINNYFKLQYQVLERLNENLKSFYKKINSAVVSLEDVQKDFELLHLLNSRVQMKEDIVKTYEHLGIFFKNWKRMLFNQNDVIKKNVKDFFKYIQMEGVAYTELIDSREVIKQKYEKENLKLQKKKDKLWAMPEKDFGKWEITEDIDKIDYLLLMRDRLYAYSKMCTNDTRALESLRKQLGQANRGNLDELKRLISKYCDVFVKNLKDFANKLEPTLNDSLSVWTSLASSVNA